MYFDMSSLDGPDPIHLNFTVTKGNGEHLISDSHHAIAGLIEVLGAIEVRGKAIDSIDAMITVSAANLEGAVCTNSCQTVTYEGDPIKVTILRNRNEPHESNCGTTIVNIKADGVPSASVTKTKPEKDRQDVNETKNGAEQDFVKYVIDLVCHCAKPLLPDFCISIFRKYLETEHTQMIDESTKYIMETLVTMYDANPSTCCSISERTLVDICNRVLETVGILYRIQINDNDTFTICMLDLGKPNETNEKPISIHESADDNPSDRQSTDVESSTDPSALEEYIPIQMNTGFVKPNMVQQYFSFVRFVRNTLDHFDFGKPYRINDVYPAIRAIATSYICEGRPLKNVSQYTDIILGVIMDHTYDELSRYELTGSIVLETINILLGECIGTPGYKFNHLMKTDVSIRMTDVEAMGPFVPDRRMVSTDTTLVIQNIMREHTGMWNKGELLDIINQVLLISVEGAKHIPMEMIHRLNQNVISTLKLETLRGDDETSVEALRLLIQGFNQLLLATTGEFEVAMINDAVFYIYHIPSLPKEWDRDARRDRYTTTVKAMMGKIMVTDFSMNHVMSLNIEGLKWLLKRLTWIFVSLHYPWDIVDDVSISWLMSMLKNEWDADIELGVILNLTERLLKLTGLYASLTNSVNPKLWILQMSVKPS